MIHAGGFAYDLAIFDVDGTLVRPRSGREFRESHADWELLPGRRETIRTLLDHGVTVAFASNQGGAAFGYFETWDMRAEIDRLAALLLGASCKRPCSPDRHVAVCWSHPDATVEYLRRLDYRRKPDPGMLLELTERFAILPADAIMVGDREEDEEAARAAKVQFAWAADYFGNGP